jgi:hypothetical protein
VIVPEIWIVVRFPARKRGLTRAAFHMRGTEGLTRQSRSFTAAATLALIRSAGFHCLGFATPFASLVSVPAGWEREAGAPPLEQLGLHLLGREQVVLRSPAWTPQEGSYILERGG